MRTVVSFLVWGMVAAFCPAALAEPVLVYFGAGSRFVGSIVEESTKEDRIRLRLESGVELSLPLSSVTARYTGEFLARYQQAERLAREQRWVEAVVAYRRAGAESPDRPFAADCVKKARETLLEAVARLEGVDDYTEVERVRQAVDPGDPETATRVLEAVTLWYRTNLAEWRMLANQAEVRNDHRGAIAYYAKAVNCATGYPDLRSDLANGLARVHTKEAYQLYHSLGDTEAVVRHIEQAIMADPEFQQAHLLKADFYCTRGEMTLDRRERAIQGGETALAAPLLAEASASFAKAAEAAATLQRIGGIPPGTWNHIYGRVMNLHNRLVARQGSVERAPPAVGDIPPRSLPARIRFYARRGWQSVKGAVAGGDFWSRVWRWIAAHWKTFLIGFPLPILGGIFMDSELRKQRMVEGRNLTVLRGVSGAWYLLVLFTGWWIWSFGDIALLVGACAAPPLAYVAYARFIYRPTGVCPSCGGSILDYEEYQDLDFAHCPHCRHPLESPLTLRDYVRALAARMDDEAMGRSAGGRGEGARTLVHRDRMVLLIRLLVTHALRRRASDVHVELDHVVKARRDLGLRSRVRLRVDGVLFYEMDFPASVHSQLVSAVKGMAEMDIADRLHPQDGHFRQTVDGADIQIRVSTSPTSTGEKMVLRLLDKRQVMRPPSELGFHPLALIEFENAIHAPQGVVLATGPSGSGKTTLLYSAVCTLLDGEKSVVSIEDPIEYDISGINQIQHDPKVGVTFSNALRNILRQDPDVIMVGEIRDSETTKMVVEAAKTGHLVFSTLHTVDACSAAARLIDMAVAPQDVAGVLRAVVAQRLVRMICPHCKAEAEPTPAERELLARELGPGFIARRGKGCPACRGTGYLGRTGLFEVFVVSDETEDLIARQAPLAEVRRAARTAGMRSLWEDGLFKVKEGITTLEEVLRIVRPPAEPASPS